MTDQDLAKQLFLRNVNTSAFPTLVKLMSKGERGHHVTEKEIDEARAALATTKMMYDYMAGYCRTLEHAYKLDFPII